MPSRTTVHICGSALRFVSLKFLLHPHPQGRPGRWARAAQRLCQASSPTGRGHCPPSLPRPWPPSLAFAVGSSWAPQRTSMRPPPAAQSCLAPTHAQAHVFQCTHSQSQHTTTAQGVLPSPEMTPGWGLCELDPELQAHLTSAPASRLSREARGWPTCVLAGFSQPRCCLGPS